ncbi:hypothetical protein METBIDRAFT_213999 [Metschnikowia bicuspidata var. bicuspidata NRRL YB-4993]|uniref:Uncharacterized protein n=1 Tax=Metschnikowia bicuspidata var. bicuspidata NRRL YB-4993 TaxID=869754 RepID=A0A1A0H5S0_9ASCO|nr:hypothetical protein METBIDRAFT_213999 [Metschnikowia bicuspidata var. bicuspidata NRRL YB-4993]OBA19434.1 hypothetical protein METBIDRAFT_213999 [Metschnikowia bicuspidata var. bicuspidata NRRL YB-4993]
MIIQSLNHSTISFLLSISLPFPSPMPSPISRPSPCPSISISINSNISAHSRNPVLPPIPVAQQSCQLVKSIFFPAGISLPHLFPVPFHLSFAPTGGPGTRLGPQRICPIGQRGSARRPNQLFRAPSSFSSWHHPAQAAKPACVDFLHAAEYSIGSPKHTASRSLP